MNQNQMQFLKFCLDTQVLLFGDFELKSGKHSPYFFNLGNFFTGSQLTTLADYYAAQMQDLEFDIVFGPAYKGIPLASACAQSLAKNGRDVGWAFNRKELKDHGEGGMFVGMPIKNKKLVVVDDVVSGGVTTREVMPMLKEAGAEVVAMVVSLDRLEKLDDGLTAIESLKKEFQIPILSIANANDLVDFVNSHDDIDLTEEHKQVLFGYIASL